MRARYYYPDLMRFINQNIVTGDISNSNSLNRYTYVEGNSATMIDPFGLCAEKAGTGLLNTIHNIFDIVGFIPGIGDACDGINGLIYLCEGDLVNAGMSLMSLVPLGDLFAKGGKRVYFIDFENKIVYELKPNNLTQIKKGTKQLAGYLEEIESVFGGGWSSILDTY